MSESREFDNALDECLERLLFKGETIEQCLNSFPQHADEIKPLLETALAAKQASAIQPRPEFRDKARYQFYTALQEMEDKRSRSLFGRLWQPRWAMAVTVVLVLILAGGGTVAAASGSMPDEALYPVKLAAEQVQLVLTPSALGKAELYAKLADKRVTEIVHMAGKNEPEQIEQIAQRLDTYLVEIAALSSTQGLAGGIAMAPAVEETPAAREVPASKGTLIAEEAPVAEEEPEAEAVLAVEETLSDEGELLVKEVPSIPEPSGGKGALVKVDQRGKLRAIVVRQANDNTARLRALLETVPESAKPALLQAIAISEAGYEKVLESLEQP